MATAESYASVVDREIPGAVGLYNHGNTCFANAIVQCLTNTEFLAEFFIADGHRAAVLAAGHVGRTCHVTENFARLLSSLWTCKYDMNTSFDFIMTVDSHARQFAGSTQNDALEFLLWLMDKINQELYGKLCFDVAALSTVSMVAHVLFFFCYSTRCNILNDITLR